MSSKVILSEAALISKNRFNHISNNLIKYNCVICDNDIFKNISQSDRYGFEYITGICQKCGNVQQYYYYDDLTIKNFYCNYYRDIYSSLSPSELFSQQYMRGKQVYNFVKEILPPNASVLEIGTGAGGILKYFQNNKNIKEVQGVDFDERYINYGISQGINIKPEGMSSLDSSHYKKYDLIILSHVLEHITNPKEFLEEVKQFLKENRFLYIEVPSLESVNKGAYRYQLSLYLQNAHFIHFSVPSLSLMLSKAGYEPIKKDDSIRAIFVESKSYTEKTSYQESLEYQSCLLEKIERKKRSILVLTKSFLYSFGGNILERIKLKNFVKYHVKMRK